MKAKNFSSLILFYFLVFLGSPAAIFKSVAGKKENIVITHQVTDTTEQADLGLELEVDNPAATPLSKVSFTVTVSNDGPGDATNVAVKDILPNGYTYVSSFTTDGNYDSKTGVWSIGSLGNGSTTNLAIEAIVNTQGNYMNLAEIISCDQPDPDSKPADGVDTDKDGNVIDDDGDDDDGDGQDVKPSQMKESNSRGMDKDADEKSRRGGEGSIQNEDSASEVNPTGIRTVLKDNNRKATDLYF